MLFSDGVVKSVAGTMRLGAYYSNIIIYFPKVYASALHIFQHILVAVIWSICRGVNEIFARMGYHLALSGSARCFGTTYRSHIPG
jgi:hypothetical protein